MTSLSIVWRPVSLSFLFSLLLEFVEKIAARVLPPPDEREGWMDPDPTHAWVFEGADEAEESSLTQRSLILGVLEALTAILPLVEISQIDANFVE